MLTNGRRRLNIFAAALLTLDSPFANALLLRRSFSEVLTVGLEKLFVEVTLAI